jgi:hypothetical protein
VCLVDSCNLRLVSCDSLWLRSVNTDNLDSIAWLDSVYVVVIRDDCDCMWCLAFWHVLGYLLKFYELFVSEFTEVMNDLKRVSGLAFEACLWFAYLCIVEHNSDQIITLDTPEGSPFHFGHNIGRPDNDSPEGNEFIDRLRSNIPHNLDIAEFGDSNHEFIHFIELVDLLLFVKLLIDVLLLEHVLDHAIKAHDHLRGEVDKLIIQVHIVLFDVKR